MKVIDKLSCPFDYDCRYCKNYEFPILKKDHGYPLELTDWEYICKIGHQYKTIFIKKQMFIKKDEKKVKNYLCGEYQRCEID